MANLFDNIRSRFTSRDLGASSLSILPKESKSQTFAPLPGYGPRQDWVGFNLLPRSKVNYHREVGNGLGSSVLMSPIKWIQRNFAEAPLEVTLKNKNIVTILEDHPMTALVEQPNPFYTWKELWKGTIYSWVVDGNGYWLKIRDDIGRTGAQWYQNITGNVKQLWYVPHWMMEPKGNGDVFITHFDYYVNGERFEVHPANVVHFRNGIDPRNPRRGMSSIWSELREIFIDDEGANFTASLLKNGGVPGVIVSPDGSGPIPIGLSEDQAKAIKAKLMQDSTGDNRGEPLVSTIPTKVQQYGFNPAQLQVGGVRDVSEERLCAALGIPAAVVGFGTGLQQTKVGATMYEMKRMAWESCLIPMQGDFAGTLKAQLLPEFEPKTKAFAVRFNHSIVAAMQDNRNDAATTVNTAITGGWGRVSEGRRLMGWEVLPADEVYLRSVNVVEVSAVDDGSLLTPPASGKGRKAHSQRIHDITANARHAKPTRKQAQLIAKLNREVIAQSELFAGEIKDFFTRMGAKIADAAMDVLEPTRPRKGLKDADAEMTGRAILDLVSMEVVQKEFGDLGGEHYLRVAKSTIAAIRSVMGLAVDLPAEREVEIVKEGGRRMGLIDLSDSLKTRLFRELSEGRTNGEGPVELARRIRESVPAGTWSTPEVRARVIARTETLNAQRSSALEAYQAADNVTEVLISDGRLETSDDECVERDGAVVSFDDAWDLVAEEHPNGTLSFAPIVGD